MTTRTDEAQQRNSDKKAVAVVVGASRGIGLAIVQCLAKQWKGKIVATCRDPENAGALNALWQFMPDRLSVLPMDVCDEDSVGLGIICTAAKACMYRKDARQ